MPSSWLLRSKCRQGRGKSVVIKCCDIGKFVCSSSATLLHKSEDKTKTKPKKSLIGKGAKSQTVQEPPLGVLKKAASFLHVEPRKPAASRGFAAQSHESPREDVETGLDSRTTSGSTLVASTNQESKIKATVLSSLATTFHRVLKSGKSNKQDEKDRSIASLQDEVQKLKTKTEAKDDLIRYLRARNEEAAGLLDQKDYQQMLDLRNSDGWTKVYMLLSIDAFDRMDVFERAMFFETEVSRKLIARAKQYVSFGFFTPDCLAIEGAPSDDADDVEHLVAGGNEGDSSSTNGQLGAEVSSTEGQADDETQSTDQQVEGEASSVEGQDSSDTFTTDVQVKDEALNTKVQVEVVPWSADAQDGNEGSRTDEERMDYGPSVPLSFSNIIGEDLLHEITGKIAAIKAYGGSQEPLEICIRGIHAYGSSFHVLESHGAERTEKKENRALNGLAKEHLHIRERTIVREFVASQNGEDVDNVKDDEESEENDEDDDEENGRDHD